MKPKSSAHYQREFRKRLREQGLVKKEVWILPEHAKRLGIYEKILRTLDPSSSQASDSQTGVSVMTANVTTNEVTYWTTESLYDALKSADLFVSAQAKVELIDGVEPVLHIIMAEYGDLPVFLTVSGEQIIVESVLWSIIDVVDVAGFNNAVLRTHKYFPLSTISLDTLGDDDYYHMFGALSSSSILPNVVFEIEALANNVLQATEAYGEFLSIPSAANN
ncbi:MAG: hypothetical protein ACI84K_000279 [Pseudohongiellaceae bacterium]|jgi:uncharacterized protein YjfI (DUF2170 family)